MAVDGKVELIIHRCLVSAGSDASYKDVYATLVTKFSTGCAYLHDRALGRLERTQEAFIVSMFDRVGMNSSSDIPQPPV